MGACAVGFLIIGDEILSGRTREKNLQPLAEMLAARGLRLREVRVVGDCEKAIADAVNALRGENDFVVTSGGIGPTHDDITTDGVAAAFGARAEENAEMLARLSANVAARGLELSAARRRMARAPQGAEMVECDFAGAPGYRIGNVFVCAGVPEIFALMAAAAVLRMPRAAALRSESFCARAPESAYAEILAQVQKAHPQVRIGSYPRAVNDCAIVFSGDDEKKIQAAKKEAAKKFAAADIPLGE